jgi:hypothetical protein
MSSSIQILVDEIKKVYAIADDYAVGSYCFYEPMDIEIKNIAEFASSVSSKLDLENWFLCAYGNYFVLEIDDKFVVVYIADDRFDDATEFVIRRCNNDQEFADMMLAIA